MKASHQGRSLTQFELRWARAALEAMYPSGACAALALGIGALDIEGFLADARSRAPAEAAFGLRVAIWIVALAPLFILRRARTIATIPQGDREVVLRALLRSPIYFVRQLVVFLKAMGGLLYGGAAPVRAMILGGARPIVSGSRIVAVRRLHRVEHVA